MKNSEALPVSLSNKLHFHIIVYKACLVRTGLEAYCVKPIHDWLRSYGVIANQKSETEYWDSLRFDSNLPNRSNCMEGRPRIKQRAENFRANTEQNTHPHAHVVFLYVILYLNN